jgi:hypothetical protein
VRPRAAAVLLALAAAAPAGCGAEDERTPRAKPVGTPSAGSVVQFADCGDWRRGSVAERRATVRELRGQLTPQSSATAASPLSDERAYQLLQKSCAADFAASLRLYKLYVRAQGFAPLAE